MHKSQVTNMNGQEVNFICLVFRGSPCRALFPTSCQSRVLGGIERPCRSWKEERARAWNLGGPLTFVGIKKQYNILDKHVYTYTHKHGNQWETVHTKGFFPGCAQGLRMALYIGLHALPARLVQKGGCRDSRQPRLRGKTCEDVRCSRNCSPECHLRSPGGLRRAW